LSAKTRNGSAVLNLKFLNIAVGVLVINKYDLKWQHTLSLPQTAFTYKCIKRNLKHFLSQNKAEEAEEEEFSNLLYLSLIPQSINLKNNNKYEDKSNPNQTHKTNLFFKSKSHHPRHQTHLH
jgi:hypothetical protein